jgi:ubiquinone/menaquinone biosynthesis C-methylase UbiE
MKAKKEHIDFYNEHYKKIQINFTSWYVFMLSELMSLINFNSKLLEIGCGQSKGLKFLIKNNFKEENIYGIDQSNEAINFSKKELPNAKLSVGDAYNLKFSDNFFDFVLLMEVIEHIEEPNIVLKEIYRVLKPGGKVFLSFPNYINFPWLIVRILAEKFNKPNWIVLQPVDKIYTTISVINFCKKNNLKYKKIIGSNYFPPILYRYEKSAITKFLNKIRLSHMSFHPVLIFEKV